MHTPSKAPLADGRSVQIFAPDQFEAVIWREGKRAAFKGPDFWTLVGRYMEFTKARVGAGGFGLIISRSSVDMLALFLAMVASRRLVSFFPPNAAIQDQNHYFEQQRSSLRKINPSSIFVFEQELVDLINRIDPQLDDRVVLVPKLSEAPAGDRAGHANALQSFVIALDNDKPIFVQHSSGTTGIKKAVEISGTALLRQHDAYWPLIRNSAGSGVRVASWLPLYHDMGLLATFLLPVLGGDSISLIDPFEWIGKPGTLFDVIEHDRCNVCWLPNFAFRHYTRLLRSLPKRDLSSIKLWVDCSEPCRAVDAGAFEEVFRDWGVTENSVVGCYAMAETVFGVSLLSSSKRRALKVPRNVIPGQDLRSIGAEIVEGPVSKPDDQHVLVLSSGEPVPGIDVDMFVGGKRVPAGVYGEVGLRGGFVFGGYRNMTQTESNIRPDGYYLTGDLGAMIDGHIYVFGRLKEIVIINGKNIFAGDVEDAVNGIPGVKKGRVVVFGVESDQTGSEELIVVAEKDQSASVADDALRGGINRLVTDNFMVRPRDIRIVNERWLVKSTSGKISRQQNRDRYLETFRK